VHRAVHPDVDSPSARREWPAVADAIDRVRHALDLTERPSAGPVDRLASPLPDEFPSPAPPVISVPAVGFELER